MSKNVCVILAAGLSSRMGSYKPLLKIQEKPSIVYLIQHLRAAGIDECIIVTGHNSDLLRDACRNFKNIIFVHNPDYDTSGMYTSAKIGFKAVPKDCKNLLFTLADIPLISESIIRKVLREDHPLVFPSYHYHRGHPVKISPDLLPALLSYAGEDGLRGAFASLDIEPFFINTEDKSILMDMDTPENYAKIIAFSQNNQG